MIVPSHDLSNFSMWENFDLSNTNSSCTLDNFRVSHPYKTKYTNMFNVTSHQPCIILKISYPQTMVRFGMCVTTHFIHLFTISQGSSFIHPKTMVTTTLITHNLYFNLDHNTHSFFKRNWILHLSTFSVFLQFFDYGLAQLLIAPIMSLQIFSS